MPMLSPSTAMATFFAASFFLNGLLFPYFPVLLTEKGLSGDQIALVMSMPFVGRIVTMPLIGFAADRMQDRRPIMMLITAGAAAALIAFMQVTSIQTVIVIGSMLLILNFVVGPLADTLAMTLVRRKMGHYGPMRAWGSVSFVAGNLIGGFVLEDFRDSLFDPLLITGAVMAVMSTAVIPSVPRLPDTLARAPFKILNNPPFVLVLVAGGFLQASHAAMNSFATLTWQQRGYDEFVIGIFWAISVIAEIILFMFATRIPIRINALWLLMAGGAIGIFRWLMFSMDTGLWLTAALQVLHAGSFAIAHIAIIRFLHEKVPEQRFASAQGLYIVLLSGLMAISGFLAGKLWLLMGDDCFIAMAGFSAAGMLLVAAIWRSVDGLPSVQHRLPDYPQSEELPG